MISIGDILVFQRSRNNVKAVHKYLCKLLVKIDYMQQRDKKERKGKEPKEQKKQKKKSKETWKKPNKTNDGKLNANPSFPTIYFVHFGIYKNPILCW